MEIHVEITLHSFKQSEGHTVSVTQAAGQSAVGREAGQEDHRQKAYLACNSEFKGRLCNLARDSADQNQEPKPSQNLSHFGENIPLSTL